MRRYLAGLLLALVLPSAFAQECPAGQTRVWTHAYSPGVDFSSGSSACSDLTNKVAQNTRNLFGSGVSVSRFGEFIPLLTCRVTGTNTTVNSGHTQQVEPTDYQMASRCIEAPPTSPTRKCPVQDGESYSFNRTEGWSTSPNSGTPVHFNASPTGSTYDTGECTVDISGGLQSEACYRSQTPAANGMYRVSCDYTGTVTGDSNGTSPPETDPNAAPPACPGTTGEVNGVPTCVPSSTGDTNPAPEKGQNENGTGNPPAGRAPDGADQGSRDGQSRTPENGNGDNSGGPAAAFNPNGAPTGDQNSDGTEEQGEPCGGPGQPVCRVKVDETGVKSSGNYSAADTALNNASQAVTEAMTSATQVTGLGGREWSFVFPSGQCTPIALGWSIWQFTLDLCDFPNIELFRALWAWAFGVLGALYIWRSASSAVG